MHHSWNHCGGRPALSSDAQWPVPCPAAGGPHVVDSRTTAYVSELDTIATRSRELNPLRSARGAPSPTGEKRQRQQNNLQPRMRLGRTLALCAPLEMRKFRGAENPPVKSKATSSPWGKHGEPISRMAAQELMVLLPNFRYKKCSSMLKFNHPFFPMSCFCCIGN